MKRGRDSMIDPIHSLAFSIQANRGVYALLLGSGVSRAAKIPTGWEVTLDLIRKLAAIQDDTADPDPEAWYREKFRKEPDYSDLLEDLAKTPAERQQLLRTYWEPSEQEREEGDKQPTAAHHAIAALAKQGFIRIIVTTNFDRLMENALRDAGIEPTVLSSPDQVQGALPLIHVLGTGKCCVLKVHGDYLDTRIRNTPTELETYPEEFNKLLDRIFEEFGLIVCGWSATWDKALRAAIERCPSRRFATYWAIRDKSNDETQLLINQRKAETIIIQDADTFFQTVQQHVQSIEVFSRPHPRSIEASVTTLERYLSEPRYRIKLFNFVDQTVERIIETTTGEAFAVQGSSPQDGKSITARVRGYDAACSTLLSMAAVGGYWAEESHYSIWQRALQRLSDVSAQNGYIVRPGLKRYPGTLLLYALGLGATEARRFPFLGRMLETIINTGHGKGKSAVQMLPPSCLSKNGDAIKNLEGMEKSSTPLNDWLHDQLKQHVRRLIPNDEKYTLIFDKLEILISLSYAFQRQRVLIGAFIHRDENMERILQEIKKSLSESKETSPFVKGGIFGKTVEDCSQSVDIVEKFIHSPRWDW